MRCYISTKINNSHLEFFSLKMHFKVKANSHMPIQSKVKADSFIINCTIVSCLKSYCIFFQKIVKCCGCLSQNSNSRKKG